MDGMFGTGGVRLWLRAGLVWAGVGLAVGGGRARVLVLAARSSGGVRLGAVLVACGVVWMFALQPPGALASANANWVTGVEALLPANANARPGVGLISVSCASAGECGAVGRYFDSSGHSEGLLQSETSGAWATGTEASLPVNASSSPNVSFSSVSDTVSCASAGNCSAVGVYRDSSNDRQGVLLTETGGAWATGTEASLPVNAGSQPFVSLSAVSCASAGDCSAVGGYVDGSGSFQGLLLTETAGVWATGVKASLPANAGALPNVGLTSVSCASAGDCTAVGTYTDSSNHSQGLLLTETAGVWATGVKASLPADAGTQTGSVRFAVGSVSCASVGNCAAAGEYTDSSGHTQGLLLTETAGAWATGVQAPVPANAAVDPMVIINAVSCSSAGNCAAVGHYFDSSGKPEGLLLTETAGVWGTGVEAGLPAKAGTIPNVVLNSVSCPSAGNCAAAGQYTDSSGHTQALLLTEASGVWATGVEAPLPSNADTDHPDAAAESVSCASAANCAAVGDYNDSSFNTQGLLLSAAPVSPTLAASAPTSATAGGAISGSAISATLAGGSAPIGTVTFTVFGPQSSPPVSCASGATAVSSASVSGNGTYHPSAGFTPATPGDYWWYASYGGDPSDRPAASACGAAMAKTVVAAGTTVLPPGPPVIGGAKPLAPALSAVKLGSKRFAAKRGTKLRLTVSQAARIRVLITKTVNGRKIQGACKRHAKTGKRCRTTITKRILTFSARAGADAFKLKLKRLATGRYAARVTAENLNGRSRTVKLKFRITHK